FSTAMATAPCTGTFRVRQLNGSLRMKPAFFRASVRGSVGRWPTSCTRRCLSPKSPNPLPKKFFPSSSKRNPRHENQRHSAQHLSHLFRHSWLRPDRRQRRDQPADECPFVPFHPHPQDEHSGAGGRQDRSDG